MRRWEWWISFALGLAALMAAYDAGQRSIVRDCREFHAFTYARSVWLCKKLQKEEVTKTKEFDI